MGNSPPAFGMFPLPAVSAFSFCSDYPKFRDTLVGPKLPWTLNVCGAFRRPRRADTFTYCVSRAGKIGLWRWILSQWKPLNTPDID